MKKTIHVILILLIIVACRNQTNRNQVDSGTETNIEQVEEVKSVYYRFPSPDEMFHFIDREGLAFNDELITPVNFADGYLDSKSQALNLGVYIADLAYITLFERQKESLLYFQVIYELSDQLRILSAFDPDLVIRYENNIKNVDSLKALADEALTDISNYLVKNDKEKIFAVISIGGFVESLYLAFQLCGDFSDKNLIVERISDQKLVLENLINFSEEFSHDQNVKDAIELLQPIRSVYNGLLSSSTDTKVRRDESGKLVITGGEQIIINEQQFNELKEATLDCRFLITRNRGK